MRFDLALDYSVQVLLERAPQEVWQVAGDHDTGIVTQLLAPEGKTAMGAVEVPPQRQEHKLKRLQCILPEDPSHMPIA